MTERRDPPPSGALESRSRFSAPTVAAPTLPAARVYIVALSLAAIAAVAFYHPAAVWPAPSPFLTTFVFVAVIAAFNSFGAFERHGEFARYVGLDGPVVLALLFVVDWKLYALGILAGEFAIFVIETAREINPTVWYLRLFNACSYIVAGAVANFVVHAISGAGTGIAGSIGWTNPTLFFAVLCASTVWKTLDIVQTHLCLALATGTPILALHVEPIQLAGEFSVLFAAVPLAALWNANAWLALFAFGAIAGGSVLLHVSETAYRLRIDERTGLTNAAAFDERFAAALAEAERQKRSFALLVIDIDHFKAVNDSFGHDLGDRVIVWFAEALASHARNEDVLARVGGEEFAMLIRNADRPEALAIGERMREAIATEPYPLGEAGSLPITASIGIAVYPDDGAETRELFRSADGALYDAKRSGRNLVRAST